ncbi:MULTISPECIES: hypothetical protein [Streptomyces]|uniref:PE-PGRS family protein n=1 Tax=Streptomyces tendae TaxID=1932 RepID=A0ABW7S6F2_STRTE|nr:hypothetical protein [Streptomyces sp. VN1]QIP73575.1 hypothetical protein EZV63_30170 [Streptomyces sp. VN1]
MSAGWCLRTTRAAVFAVVCVLLAALGHVTMSDASVPWWALAVPLVTCGGAAWCLAGRERGLLPVSFAVVAAQTALHEWFSYAQALSTSPMRMAGTAEDTLSGYHQAAATHAGHAMRSMAHGDSAMGAADAMDPATGIGHTMGGGMSSTGMLAAHLLAACLTGLWLAHGERATFCILRAVVGRLAAPLRLLLALPEPSCRPRVVLSRERSDHRPRRLLLVYVITSRGPPEGTAVV